MAYSNKQKIEQTIADYKNGALAYTDDEVGLLVKEIERLRKSLQKIADMDKHSGSSLRARAASEAARKALA